MIFDKYLDEEELDELFENYHISYLKNIDSILFEQNYQLLVSLGFDYMEDLVIKYLALFTLDTSILEKRLRILKNMLGENYIEIISNNLTILDSIIK